MDVYVQFLFKVYCMCMWPGCLNKACVTYYRNSLTVFCFILRHLVTDVTLYGESETNTGKVVSPAILGTKWGVVTLEKEGKTNNSKNNGRECERDLKNYVHEIDVHLLKKYNYKNYKIRWPSFYIFVYVFGCAEVRRLIINNVHV